MAENQITEIENLESNTELRVLDLSFNKIRFIPEMPGQDKLEELWVV